MTIVSPLMPQLGVVDAVLSVAFYRDVLGFKVNWEHQERGKQRQRACLSWYVSGSRV